MILRAIYDIYDIISKKRGAQRESRHIQLCLWAVFAGHRVDFVTVTTLVGATDQEGAHL